MVQDEITILIKTFMRPDVCTRLINSIRARYPYIRIFVAVDDDLGFKFANIDKQFDMPFDSGISTGRNLLVENCETPYCVILDDDCIFTDKTNLEGVLEELKERDLDMIQFSILTHDRGEQMYRGLIELEDDIIYHKAGSKDGFYDFILNIFLAKTETVKKYKWDERLKLGEHAHYFRVHLGKLRIGYTDKGEIIHEHVDNENYKKYRARAMDFVRQGMKDAGFRERIDAWGGSIKI